MSDANEASTAGDIETAKAADEQLFPADVADEAKVGRHTAESVFSNFGKGDEATAEDGAEEDAPVPATEAPRKCGRKPFAEQSVQTARSRRTPAPG